MTLDGGAMLTLTIETENDAFQPEPAEEVARILEEVAARIRADGAIRSPMPLRDVNGTRVGTLEEVTDA
jgi:hypothetical protein